MHLNNTDQKKSHNFVLFSTKSNKMTIDKVLSFLISFWATYLQKRLITYHLSDLNLRVVDLDTEITLRTKVIQMLMLYTVDGCCL